MKANNLQAEILFAISPFVDIRKPTAAFICTEGDILQNKTMGKYE
jgi:hypothetical protein